MVVVLKLKVVKMLVDRICQGVHLSRKPQRAGLITEEAPTKVPVEYANFADVFSLDLFGLPKHTRINDCAIKLVDANEFMRPSKSPTGAPIFFDQKLVRFLQLCVNYSGLKTSQSRTGTVALN